MLFLRKVQNKVPRGPVSYRNVEFQGASIIRALTCRGKYVGGWHGHSQCRLQLNMSTLSIGNGQLLGCCFRQDLLGNSAFQFSDMLFPNWNLRNFPENLFDRSNSLSIRPWCNAGPLELHCLKYKGGIERRNKLPCEMLRHVPCQGELSIIFFWLMTTWKTWQVERKHTCQWPESLE